MNIFHAQFSTGQVLQATGVSNATLQTWLKRGLIVAQENAPILGGGSPGAHRRFSFYNVMEIAVTKALGDVGLSVSDAIHAALHFAHTGASAIGDRRIRHPSLPFDTRTDPCFTVLCAAGAQSQVLEWVPGSGSGDVMAIARHVLGNPLGFVVLQINPLFELVTAALGYDYRDVLESAYGPVGTGVA